MNEYWGYTGNRNFKIEANSEEEPYPPLEIKASSDLNGAMKYMTAEFSIKVDDKELSFSLQKEHAIFLAKNILKLFEEDL